MLIKHIYRVLYYNENSFIDGEIQPDLFETKDFLVFTKAVKFAQSNSDIVGAAQIEQIDIYLEKSREKEKQTGEKWEVTQTEYHKIS